jgi:hypothetical protein
MTNGTIKKLKRSKSDIFVLRFKSLLFFWIPLILVSLTFGGCTTNNTTNPVRSATEQLLLSTAADHALKSANLSVFANQKVFLDTNYFDSYDSKYALGTVRDALSQQGAILEDFRTNSDIIIEARSGALSIDNSTFLFGIPTIGAPIPLTGGIQTPELAFYKSQKQNSFAKIALLAYSEGSGSHIYSSGPLDGKAYNNHYNLLFVSWIRTDLPEKSKKQTEGTQVYPQHNLTNSPTSTRP